MDADRATWACSEGHAAMILRASCVPGPSPSTKRFCCSCCAIRRSSSRLSLLDPSGTSPAGSAPPSRPPWTAPWPEPPPAAACPCWAPLLAVPLPVPEEPWVLLATAVAPPAAEPAVPDVVDESPPPPPQAVRANREEARATAMALDWKGEREAVDFMAAPDRSGWKDDRKLAAWPSASHPNWCDMKSLSTDRQDGSEGMHGRRQAAGRPRPDGLS